MNAPVVWMCVNVPHNASSPLSRVNCTSFNVPYNLINKCDNFSQELWHSETGIQKDKNVILFIKNIKKKKQTSKHWPFLTPWKKKHLNANWSVVLHELCLFNNFLENIQEQYIHREKHQNWTRACDGAV